MANNNANMGWGDAEEAREGAENDARAGGEVPDGEDGGGPGAGGGQQEEEAVGDGGQLKYVSYMMANAASNAGITEATVAHLKARGVEPGGDMDTVVLGGEQTPLVTFWGIPQELIEKTEDVVVIGSDPRDSLMYGFEVPMNIDLKMAMKAVRKVNKKKKSVNPHAAELKMTLVTQPELFNAGRGPGPYEGSYLLLLEHAGLDELARDIEAVGDSKMALRVERPEAGGELVRIVLQTAGLAARIYARDLTLNSE